MRLLTQDAILVCKHELGIVGITPSQKLFTINGRKVLVEQDPQGKKIVGCPMYGPAVKPCSSTLAVQTGYSAWLRVEGRRICLDTVTGLTDGSPPGTVKYKVRRAGQDFVSEV